jgi:hypothetical protein
MQIKIGQLVHYYQRLQMDELDKLPRPAHITNLPPIKSAMDGPWVGLCIMNPNGHSFGLYPYSETPKPGYWTLPPKD